MEFILYLRSQKPIKQREKKTNKDSMLQRTEKNLNQAKGMSRITAYLYSSLASERCLLRIQIRQIKYLKMYLKKFLSYQIMILGFVIRILMNSFVIQKQ